MKNIIIVGGGVIGLACAHYLRDSGASVTVVERDIVGAAASHGNCGLLCFSDIIPLCSPGTVGQELVKTLKGTSPLYIKPRLDPGLFIWLARFALSCSRTRMTRPARAKHCLLTYSARLFDRLLDDVHMNCDFEKNGFLMVYKDRQRFESYAETNEFLRPYGMAARKIQRDALLEMEPALRDDVVGAWFSPYDWSVRPDAMMAAWRDHLEEKGVVMKEHCRVEGIDLRGGVATGLRTNDERLSADAFVLAAGAWTPQTFKQLKLPLPVQPGKGYSITMGRPGCCPIRPCSLAERKVVVTPWKSGYRLGGTMEFSGYNDRLNPGRLSRLISGAGEYMKEPLGTPVVEEWTGLRPMTCDDMPVIDRSPGLDNLVIATGHGMLGMTLATATGKIVSDLIFDRPPEIDITPFSMDRF